jgi:orotate phosphoribosyltransferase
MEEQGMAAERVALKAMIRDRAYKKNSRFKTPGKVVSTYFDFLEISLKHHGVELAGQLVYNEIKDLDIQAIGGPNHGVASIICRAAFLKKIGVFYVRDSIKREGDFNQPKWIESRICGEDRVVIVGDVISSGSQVIRAIEAVMELGGLICKIIIIIDTMDGDGVGNIKRFLSTNMLKVPVKVLFNREELLNRPDPA